MENKLAPEKYSVMFKQEIVNVWRNSDKAINFMNIIVYEREQDVLMSIKAGHIDYSSKAVGLNLTKRFGDRRPIVLFVSPRSLQLPESEIRALMRHEALHIGYPRHDDNFKYYVKKINAPLTEYEQQGHTNDKYKVQYQPKKGTRFKTIREFADKEEAIAFSRIYSRTNLVKTRVSWMT